MVYAYSMDKVESQLIKANDKLTRVRIRRKGNRLYLRATLPDATGKAKQRDISTGLPYTSHGISIALAKAQKLESDLNLERFDWADWVDSPPRSDGLTVTDAIARFEQHYWETRVATPSRLDSYRLQYTSIFSQLPADATVTPELLRSLLVQFPADKRDRLRAYVSLGALARFLGMELPSDWRKLRGEYKPSRDRKIPSDEEIEKIRDSIKDPFWQWVFGILAAYGIRPHEVYHLDLSKMPTLIVRDGTKTGYRLVYPMPKRWVNQWNLADAPDVPPPDEATPNRVLGNRVSSAFSHRKLGIVAYSLRDAYAIRGAVMGVDSAIVSKWMGHSLSVHFRHYQRFLDEVDYQKVWDGMGE